MKKKLSIALMLLIIFFFSCEKKNGKETEVQTPVINLLNAFSRQDIEAIRKVYHQDVISYWSLGITLKGIDEHIDQYASSFGNLEKLDTVWRLEKISVQNETAWMMGIVKYKDKKSGVEVYKLKSSFIVQKFGKDWLIVHEHSTLMNKNDK